jgi:toluene monooxygenase system protein E
MTDDLFHLPNRATFKTYSHLAESRRIPSDYEVTSSKMLYYFDKGGFEVNTPIASWYERYQRKSAISPIGLESFVDPLHTTYTSYICRQKDKEIVLDAHFRFIEETAYDKQLDKEWLENLSRVLAPIRYPWHGFQMIAAYIGSMAPEGKVAITSAFQSMDEMRRIQWAAYRMRQLQLTYPSWGADSLAQWQEAPHWQPLRRGVERLLTTYDWMEAFVGLNLCLKPMLDRLVLSHYATLATLKGDSQLELMSRSFYEDAQWHQSWSQSLIRLILTTRKEHKKIISKWASYWLNEMEPIAKAFEPFFIDFDLIYQQLFEAFKEQLIEFDLDIEVQ